jgi:hypothetical protein
MPTPEEWYRIFFFLLRYCEHHWLTIFLQLVVGIKALFIWLCIVNNSFRYRTSVRKFGSPTESGTTKRGTTKPGTAKPIERPSLERPAWKNATEPKCPVFGPESFVDFLTPSFLNFIFYLFNIKSSIFNGGFSMNKKTSSFNSKTMISSVLPSCDASKLRLKRNLVDFYIYIGGNSLHVILNYSFKWLLSHSRLGHFL